MLTGRGNSFAVSATEAGTDDGGGKNRVLRLMTYNVHGCVGMDGRLSPERIAGVIQRYEPDVVALQELDVGRKRSGGVDQARHIADLVEMESHFHAAVRMEEEEYGDAIISKLPMRLVRAGLLPSVPRRFIKEERGALWVDVEFQGARVQIINTHLGLGRRERRLQAQALLTNDWAGAARNNGPVIVCGDFNSPHGRVVYGEMTSCFRDVALQPDGARQPTFATTFPFLCIDHVFASPELDSVSSFAPRTPLTKIASDHFPLVVDLRLAAAR